MHAAGGRRRNPARVPERRISRYGARASRNQLRSCSAWHDGNVVQRLEWWPEYDGGPLWDEAETVPLDDLGLAPDLVERLAAWNSSYTDDRLPIGGPGDVAWLAEGPTS